MNERARPQSTTQHAHVTVSLHHIVALIDAYADARLTADFGVSFSEYHVIAVLFDEEPTDVTGLASCLGISKAAVSKRLPSLVRSGLVTTNPDPDHGRRILITLTDQARAIVAQAARNSKLSSTTRSQTAALTSRISTLTSPGSLPSWNAP